MHSIGFCQVKVYFKVCFEVRKIRHPFFSCQSLLLVTNVPNDICVYVYYTYTHIYIHMHAYIYIYICIYIYIE